MSDKEVINISVWFVAFGRLYLYESRDLRRAKNMRQAKVRFDFEHTCEDNDLYPISGAMRYVIPNNFMTLALSTQTRRDKKEPTYYTIFDTTTKEVLNTDISSLSEAKVTSVKITYLRRNKKYILELNNLIPEDGHFGFGCRDTFVDTPRGMFNVQPHETVEFSILELTRSMADTNGLLYTITDVEMKESAQQASSIKNIEDEVLFGELRRRLYKRK